LGDFIAGRAENAGDLGGSENPILGITGEGHGSFLDRHIYYDAI
jgi:hypothetical protein